VRHLKYPQGMSSFDCHLFDLRKGRRTFDQFAASTHADWTRLAKYVLARWSVPSAVEVADVQQEMLLAAWRAVSDWDDTRGVSLHGHVLWNAVTSAKKWLHKQRNAHRRDDHAMSRHDICIGSVGVATGDRSPVDAPEPPMQETMAISADILRKEFHCDSSELAGLVEKLMSKKGRTPRIKKAMRSAIHAFAE